LKTIKIYHAPGGMPVRGARPLRKYAREVQAQMQAIARRVLKDGGSKTKGGLLR